MAELSDIRETVRERYAAAATIIRANKALADSCCTPEALASCCDQSAKRDCCAAATAEPPPSCGCA